MMTKRAQRAGMECVERAENNAAKRKQKSLFGELGRDPARCSDLDTQKYLI